MFMSMKKQRRKLVVCVLGEVGRRQGLTSPWVTQATSILKRWRRKTSVGKVCCFFSISVSGCAFFPRFWPWISCLVEPLKPVKRFAQGIMWVKLGWSEMKSGILWELVKDWGFFSCSDSPLPSLHHLPHSLLPLLGPQDSKLVTKGNKIIQMWWDSLSELPGEVTRGLLHHWQNQGRAAWIKG